MARTDEVSPNSKQVLDGGVYNEESLSLARRLESSHLAFSLSRGLMRSFGPVVFVLFSRVGDRWEQFSMSGPVASELICNEPVGNSSLTFQELTEEPLGSLPISSLLEQDIDRVPILIDRSPQVETLSPDGHEELVQMSDVAQLAFAISQPARIGGSELSAPVSNRLVGNDDPSLGQEILDVSQAEGKSVVEPDGMADDRRWEAVTGVAGPVLHLAILPDARLT